MKLEKSDVNTVVENHIDFTTCMCIQNIAY